MTYCSFRVEIDTRALLYQFRVDNVRLLGKCCPRKSKVGPRRQRSVWVLPR